MRVSSKEYLPTDVYCCRGSMLPLHGMPSIKPESYSVYAPTGWLPLLKTSFVPRYTRAMPVWPSFMSSSFVAPR